MVKVPQEDLPELLPCQRGAQSTVLGSPAQPSEKHQAQSTRRWSFTPQIQKAPDPQSNLL